MPALGQENKLEMLAKRYSGLLRFFSMYYLANMVLLLSYPIMRAVLLSYKGPFTHQALPAWERQAAGTLAVATVVKFIRSPSLDAFFADFFMYSKGALGVIIYMLDKWVFGAYMGLCLAMFVLFPQPTYQGPGNFMYLTPSLFDDIVIKKSKEEGLMWLVEFYASWSPLCVQMEPIFSELSLKYATPKVKFAKLDVGRWPRFAKEWNISVQGTSKQLPTFIMFQNGKELGRIPHIFKDGSVAKGRYRKNDLIKAFELDALYVRTSSQCHDEKSKESKKDA